MLDRTQIPPVSPMGRLILPEPTRNYLLDNGASLTIYDGGEAEVNRLCVYLDGGRYESSQPLLLSLVNSMIPEGSKKYTGAEIADIFETNGSWSATQTKGHHSVQTLFSLNRRFGRVIDTFADMILYPSFPRHEQQVATEKGARLLELRHGKVKVRAASLARQMYYGEESIGSAECTPEMARSYADLDLAPIYARMLEPKAMHIYLAGRITREIEEMVASRFGHFSATGPGLERRMPAINPVAAGTIEKDTMPETRQSALKAFIPTIDRCHPDYILLRMAVTLLGGFFGSRLMLNIREDKGYTYGINAMLVGTDYHGRFFVDTECDARYVEGVMEEVRREMARMADPASYTDEELSRVKEFAMTQLASTLDSPFNILDYHILEMTTGTPKGYFAMQQDVLESLSPEALAEVSRKYLQPEQLRWAIAGV